MFGLFKKKTEKEKLMEQNIYALYEKPMTRGWKLEERWHASGPRIFRLVDADGDVALQGNWGWADWMDRSFVYAHEGCLFRVRVKKRKKLSEPEMIHDFNHYQFEAIQAPY